MANIKQKVILKFKDDAFVNKLIELLLKAGKVKISGLGIFEIRDVKARQSYGIGGGEVITIPAHKKVAFKPTQKIKESIQKYGR